MLTVAGNNSPGVFTAISMQFPSSCRALVLHKLTSKHYWEIVRKCKTVSFLSHTASAQGAILKNKSE